MSSYKNARARGMTRAGRKIGSSRGGACISFFVANISVNTTVCDQPLGLNGGSPTGVTDVRQSNITRIAGDRHALKTQAVPACDKEGVKRQRCL